MNILGISCWYHDSAAALLSDGEVVAASQEERFSRVKHDFEFPERAIDFCLEQGGISEADIDFVVFYDKPIPKFERIISSILYTVPRSRLVFREAVPLWLTRKLKFHKTVKKKLSLPPEKVCFCSHHMAHAASCFYLSPFRESAVLTVDGVGEWATASIGKGSGKEIRIIKEMRFPHSLGLLYSAFTAFLGFKVNNGEYKVMGMAPYGEPKYTDKVYRVAGVNDDGSVELNMDYFTFHHSVSKTYGRKFTELFGPEREPESLFFTEETGFPSYLGEKPPDFSALAEKNRYYADIAASIQKVLEDTLLKMARTAREETGLENLCYAGGVALNSKANYELVSSGIFSDIFIQPAATDAGGALGAALWLWSGVLGNEPPGVIRTPYLGKGYSNDEIKKVLTEENIEFRELEDERLFDYTARQISEGKVIGWFQGRAEWGPRALGNRSILADPRDPEMKDRVNSLVKFREPYRPFAPSVLNEDAGDYIKRERELIPDEYMLVTYPVNEDKKDLIPAVTHVNCTARAQVVKRERNPRYWKLIKSFRDLTGVGVLLNTSFNLKGEPVVNSPLDALKTFRRSGIDLLVMENLVVSKSPEGKGAPPESSEASGSSL